MKMIIILIYKVKRGRLRQNEIKTASYPNRGLICEEFARLIFVLIFARFMCDLGGYPKTEVFG